MTFSWDIVERFEPEFAIQTNQHFEKWKGMYESLDRHVLYNHADPSVRYGVLMARFVRRNRASKGLLVRRSRKP